MHNIITGTIQRVDAGKFLLALLVALALVLGVGASTASADLTVAALSVTSTGAFTLTPATASAIVIGATDGTGAITVGASTGTGQTVNIGSGATTGSDVVNVGTGTATTLKTVNIATGAISAVNIGTGNFVNTIAIGTHATPINVITVGGAASTLSIGATLLGASPLVFEALTADAFEATLAVADVTADRTITIPDRTGQVKIASAASVITAGATPTLTVGLSNLYTDTITTDNQDQTITFSGAGTAGDVITIVFITDAAGVGDEVITFHTTLTNTIGTLTLANLASGRYTVTLMSDGTVWNEVARTAAQT